MTNTEKIPYFKPIRSPVTVGGKAALPVPIFGSNLRLFLHLRECA